MTGHRPNLFVPWWKIKQEYNYKSYHRNVVTCALVIRKYMLNESWCSVNDYINTFSRWAFALILNCFHEKEASDDSIHSLHTSNSGLLIHTSANSKTWMITAASARQRDKHCEVRSQSAAHATMNQQYASITSRSTDSPAGQLDSSIGHDRDCKFVQSLRPHSHSVLVTV